MADRLTNEEIQQTNTLIIRQVEYIESERQLLLASGALVNFNIAQQYEPALRTLRSAVAILDAFQNTTKE